MSTHAFIPDSGIDQLLHIPLQTPMIIIFTGLIVIGIITLYVLFFRNGTNRLKYLIFG